MEERLPPIVGCVIVRNGEVIARAGNRTLAHKDPTAHAEIAALREAGAALGNYRLPGCEIYVTLEPCAMCAGAIMHARLSRLVYGARDEKAGALGSVYDIGRDGRLNHRIEVYAGVKAEECGEMLREFFRARRAAGDRE